MDKIEDLVEQRLKEMNVPATTLKPTTLKHLIKIEELISTNLDYKKELLQKFKEKKITILSVSEESKISRQTFYNNPILKEYIQFALDTTDLLDPYKKNEELSLIISELQEVVLNMQIRDIDFELLTNQVNKLKKELKEKKNDVTKLKKQKKELSDKLLAIKHDKVIISSNKSNIVQFSSKK